MKTKTLPTGIVTTQRKVGKKIIIDVKRPTSSKTVTRLQKIVVGFLFCLAYLGICGSTYLVYMDLFSRALGVIFLPLFLGKIYIITIMGYNMFHEFKRKW
tara:strand:- start:4280 stop:4579 length:300 start_codon:yes stop_codon:yes gene_type:complete